MRSVISRLIIATIISVLPLSLSHAADLYVTITIDAGQNHDFSGGVVTLQPLFQFKPNQPKNITLEAVKITQINRQFEPFIQVVNTNRTVEFPNLDSVAHHVYSFSRPNQFELPLYQKGHHAVRRFSQPGVVIVGCNIHDWMISYLYVTDSPLFKKAEGNQVIFYKIPLGEYQLQIWHPGLNTKTPIKNIILSKNITHTEIKPKAILRNIIQPSALKSNFDEDGY